MGEDQQTNPRWRANPQVHVFLGSPFVHASEQTFLTQLRRDLEHRGVGARIFANFNAPGRSQRQIDFVIVTDARCTHVELKSANQAVPLCGPLNGPWQQIPVGGSPRSLESNYSRQAIEGTYAVGDAMREVARSGDAPDQTPFPKHIDTVVCVTPRVPPDSQITCRDHVSVVGYDELLARLIEPGPYPAGWEADHWDVFTRHLGVYHEEEDVPEARQRRTEAAAVSDYLERFRFHQSVDLHELVPLALTLDGEPSGEVQLADLLQRHGKVVLLGCSGAGKTHLIGVIGPTT